MFWILSSILNVLCECYYKSIHAKYEKIIKYSHIYIVCFQCIFVTVSGFKLKKSIKILKHSKYECCSVPSGLGSLNFSVLYINVLHLFAEHKWRDLMFDNTEMSF